MSLKANIVANYASQLYVAILGIVVVPVYVGELGLEAYGLIGFFAMLQAWFGLLDMGLSPTIGRETARVNGGASTPNEYRQIFRSLSMLFATFAVLGGIALLFSADAITTRWLKTRQLSHEEVTYALQIMVLSIVLRWMGGLYRGVVTGYERLIWLSGFNVAIASLRFLGVLAVMHLAGHTPTVFFTYQAIVAVVEFSVLCWMTYRVLPAIDPTGSKVGWSVAPVKKQLAFAGAVAFTSSVWVIVTQLDKLLLSGILSLSDYGNYSLAVLIASGITTAVAPIAASITPRLAVLEAQGRPVELIATYRRTTKLVSVLGGTAGVSLIFLTAPVLKAWTGNETVVGNVVPIVVWYALGNMMLNFSSFAYSLQYAKGTMRYHVIGNILMLALLLPTLFFLAQKYGTYGAGLTWGIINTAYLLGWVCFTHARLVPKLSLKWIVFDILIIIVPLALVAAGIAHLIDPLASRFQNIAICGISGLILVGIGYLFNKLSQRIESAFARRDAVHAALENA